MPTYGHTGFFSKKELKDSFSDPSLVSISWDNFFTLPIFPPERFSIYLSSIPGMYWYPIPLISEYLDFFPPHYSDGIHIPDLSPFRASLFNAPLGCLSSERRQTVTKLLSGNTSQQKIYKLTQPGVPPRCRGAEKSPRYGIWWPGLQSSPLEIPTLGKIFVENPPLPDSHDP